MLGVQRSADERTIRTAYRKAVLKWHPDKNPGKEERAQVETARLNNAYECLSDVTARRDFDTRFPKAGGGGSGKGSADDPPRSGSHDPAANAGRTEGRQQGPTFGSEQESDPEARRKRWVEHFNCPGDR